MMIDIAANFGNILTVSLIIFSAIGAWFAVRHQVKKHGEDIKEIEQNAKAALDANQVLQDNLRKLELQMLREFVTNSAMRDLELRIQNSISELRSDIGNLTKLLLDKKNT